MSVRHLVRLSATLAAFAALTVPAAAHPGHASVFGFDVGVLHWLTSVQHGLVMVIVGIAGAIFAGHVSQPSSRTALRLGGGAVAALGVALVLV